MIEFRMPSLGADMESGTMVSWSVKPGDHVKRGDIVAVVETEKGAIEIEIFNAGTIAELVAPLGAKVPVGSVLARLDGEAAEAANTHVPAGPPPPSPEPTPTAPIAPAIPQAAPATGVRASPAARRLAAEIGVDLRHTAGSGPAGAITLADVEHAGRKPAVGMQPRRGGFDPAAMRQIIATAMSRSKREIPHYYLSQTVELAAAQTFLQRRNSERAPPERILLAALFLRAIALALVKLPDLNGFWENGKFRPGDGVHIGWAIALRGGGLVAPAIHDVDKRSLDELMDAMRDLVGRARGFGLRSSELSDPTITVTNLGDRGAESVQPIIYPPQVAIVGIGRVVTRPWVTDDAIGPRPVVTMTLAGDHRASDGHRGGLLLSEIDRLLREPEAL